MSEPLADYRSKRDFAVTAEPAGGGPAAEGRRFVIQEHHARRLHWDLRLERDGVLASWAVPKGLPEAPGSNHFAARTEDHPLEYIDFHGEIPKGQYGAGTMTIWDRGTYETLKWEPRKVEVALHGERVRARYALFAIGPGDAAKDWMVHRMDPPEDPDRRPLPERVVPMRARAAARPPDGPDWAHEIRWRGSRALAYSSPGELRFEGAGLRDLTPLHPELGRLGRALGSRSAVLDGVIVAEPPMFVICDLLWLDGHWLIDLPYSDRRARLEGLGLDGDHWRTPSFVAGAGAEVLAASAAHGLGGTVAKRLDSPYRPGLRSPDWVAVGGPASPVGDGGGREPSVVDYYAAVGPTLMPHVAGRALTVAPWPAGRPVPGVDDVAGLVALAQDGAVSLRVPLAGRSGRPVAVVFGLGRGSWADCCAVALRLQGMLSRLGLECFGKACADGLEVHLPVGGGATFAATSAFARLVAEVLAGDDPDLVAATPGPVADGRVLVDWGANRAQATTVAPYSLLEGGAVVATPLAWDELDIGPVTPGRMLGRVERLGDLFAPVACLDQPLPRL